MFRGPHRCFVLGKNVSLGIIGVCPSTSWGSQHLGCGGELLDGAVVVLGSQSLQRVPAVCVQFNDLHEERTGQLGLRRTQHLVPDGRQKLRHHFWELLFQETSHALQLEDGRGRGDVRRVGVSTCACARQKLGLAPSIMVRPQRLFLF